VANYLSSQGVDGSRLSTRGNGPDQPIATNATAEGKAQNRRVEVNLKPLPEAQQPVQQQPQQYQPQQYQQAPQSQYQQQYQQYPQ
jgi:hypothetical protein